MSSRPMIFISCSRADLVWKDRLLRHLGVLERQAFVDVWDEGRIAAGNEWHREIEAAIAAAHIAVLLVSADFLGSTFLAEEEVPRLLVRRASDSLPVLPVLLRPCDWKAVAWLAPLRLHPRDDRAVAAGTEAQIDADFAALATEIRGLLGSTSQPVQLLALHEGPGGVPITAVPHFIGRADEMRDLCIALADGNDVCVVATGLGGIGKTSLARQFVATEARAMFPDGSVWIDAMNLDADTARAAARFGLRPQRRPTVAEAARFLAVTLYDKRALVVVDNVPSTVIDPKTLPIAQGKSRTIITSRTIGLHESLDRPAQSLLIGCWSNETCRAYLRDVVPALAKSSDKDLDAVAKFVDRLPLAVRLLARLLKRPGMTPTRLLERLTKEPLGTLDKVATGVDRGVAATFKASYEELDDTHRRVLVALVACARVTSEGTVARIAGLGDDAAADVLADLAERSLVDDVDGEARLWTLHDVVRLFVREQDGVRQADEVHLAFAEQHVEAHQDPEDWQAMDTGMEEVLTAVDRLFDAGEAERAARLVARADEHLMRRGRYAEIVARYELLAARLPQGSEERAIVLRNTGRCYRALGDIPRAIEHHQRSLTIEENLGHLEGQAAALCYLGLCYRILGDVPQAIEHHQRSLTIEEKLGHLEGQADDIGALGLCYHEQRDLPKAIEHHQRSLALFEQIGQLEGQGDQLCNLGYGYLEQGAIDEALQYLQRALAIEENLGRLEDQAVVLSCIGGCYETQGHGLLALDHLERALVLYRRIGIPDYQSDVHDTLDTVARVRAALSA